MENKLNPELIELLRREYSLSDLAYEVIRDAIISGSYFPGEQLKQLDLADAIGVSQRTVREALKRLAAIGLVNPEAYKGFYVIQVPVEEEEKIYRLRGNLEVYAVPEMIKYITENELQKMEELLPRTITRDKNLPVGVVRKANRSFHLIPVSITRNPQLIRIFSQVWDISMTYYKEERLTEEDRRRSYEVDLNEHEAYITALRARDSRRTREIIEAHIKTNIGWLYERSR